MRDIQTRYALLHVFKVGAHRKVALTRRDRISRKPFGVGVQPSVECQRRPDRRRGYRLTLAVGLALDCRHGDHLLSLMHREERRNEPLCTHCCVPEESDLRLPAGHLGPEILLTISLDDERPVRPATAKEVVVGAARKRSDLDR